MRKDYILGMNMMVESADLVAVKMESQELYYIHKDRYGKNAGLTISCGEFLPVLQASKSPLIISEKYFPTIRS